MAKAFPDAPIYTSVYHPGRTFPDFAGLDIRPSVLNRVPPLRRWHRATFPVLAGTFGRMSIDADVVLASSAGFAHGVHTTGRKVVYCHTPARWLHQPAERYLGRDPLRRAVLGSGLGPLRAWDLRAAASAQRYVANSSVVAGRVRDVYGLAAEVIHPPSALDPLGPAERPAGCNESPGFVLCIGRLVPYKNVPAVIEAFRALPDRRLVVVGRGRLQRRLLATKPTNVTMIETVTDAGLRWLYGNSVALVAASYEDFGITPLEANSFARPVAALRWGGFLDTIIEDRTGVYFDQPQPAAIAGATRRLLDRSWDGDVLRAHAGRFSEAAFVDRLRAVVADVAR